MTNYSTSTSGVNGTLRHFDREKLIWDAPFNVNQKITLLALNSFVDGDGRCWPGQAKLAGMTGLTDRTIRNVCSSLEAYEFHGQTLNILERIARYKDGHRTSSIYKVNFHLIPKPEPDSGMKKQPERDSGMKGVIPEPGSGKQPERGSDDLSSLDLSSKNDLSRLPPTPQGGTHEEAATPSGGKKSGREKRRTPPSISRYHPEEALELWEKHWTPMYKGFRGELDDRKLFMEGFDILVERGTPLHEIVQGTRFYCETKQKYVDAKNIEGTKMPPDGIRFFRGKNGGESYCLRAYAMWKDRQGTKEQAQEDELALSRQIGKHQARLGIIGQPPKEWRDKSGCKTVGDMTVSQKREYLDYLISRSENDGSDTASPMSGTHPAETLGRVA